MKIKRLHLENFRVHGDSELTIGDASFVVIRGRNFAGKSTIGQALSMCLTPSTTGLDPRGWGYTAKIKRGASKAVITADIQTKRYLIERTVTLNQSGRTQRSICLSDPDWNPAPFDRQLETHRVALTVALNTDAFLRMDEKEQKNLLAGLALPAHYDFDRQIVEDVEEALGKGEVKFDAEPFAVITQAHKKLFEERQLVNRQAKEFTIPAPLPVPPGVDSYSLQEELSALRLKRKERMLERDKAVAETNKVEVARARATARIQSLEQSIADDRRQAAALGGDILMFEDRLASLRKVAAGKAELDRLSQEKIELDKLLSADQRQLARTEQIPKAGSKCPTCDQVVDAEKLKAMTASLLGLIQEAKDRDLILQQKINALGEVEDAIRQISQHESAGQRLAAIEAQVKEKQCLLDEAREREVPEPALFDFQPYDQSIAAYDAEIEKRDTQLRPVIAAEERKKEIEIRQEQLRRLKAKAGMLDQLVKYFGPDGIKTKLIGEYIGGFEAKLNEVLTAWGYSGALSIEPYAFDVTNARGDVNPVRELSGAEKVMFSLAFQCAVSRTANLGLVVIDEVAMLLPELRPTLNKRLYEMIQSGYLEQVIMLVADSSERVSSLQGAAFFMVENGTVYPLGGMQQAKAS